MAMCFLFKARRYHSNSHTVGGRLAHCDKMPPKKGKGKGKKKGKGDKKVAGPPPPTVQEEEPLNELSKAFYLIQIKVRI